MEEVPKMGILAISADNSYFVNEEFTCEVTNDLPPFPVEVERLEWSSVGFLSEQSTLVICGGYQVGHY